MNRSRLTLASLVATACLALGCGAGGAASAQPLHSSAAVTDAVSSVTAVTAHPFGPAVSSAAAVRAFAPALLPAKKPVVYKNCTALQKKHPHGVGLTKAKDRVRGKTKPVTNFTRNDALYKANAKHDRDKDGVACEKR
ncbi:excalibur calcium-binding domain-containing protein [Mycetocola reblochoni]|uniref:Excalibur calcium-binding domain-containing protein n=2 Tax=Mycetocola reblochoni TaxID=331618 RepID=A0A1R4ISH3_9MICO|nr:excalibur calcium-binding domain-containing protein [Mycetocola reblochoni]RLP71144.1 hypothetical protein D9V30_01650 [Mycetocola reblochoni]SJN22609.1 hypothetical protein FM119_03265 [Mycetocola reblochoni REB411]